MKKIVFVLAAVIVSFSTSVASAEESKVDWTKCAAELKKFNCEGKDDEGTWNCLLPHDKEISAECETAHLAYEKLTGKA